MGLQMFQLHNKVIDKIEASPWQIRETNLRLGIGLLVLFLYLLIGAIVFVQIEGPEEEKDMTIYEEFRSHWNRELQSLGYSEEDVDQLFADIRKMALRGIWTEKNVTSEPNWSFGQAFFFTGALISTVGYGRISPKTREGKFFTIVYCIIGIPMTLALLSALVVRLKQPSAWLRGKLNTWLGHLFHANQIQIFHLSVVCSLMLLFVFVIPSLIFCKIEIEWTFLDAFFYCFVSLTTIGLGDYVPGDEPNQQFRAFYKFLVTVYLLFGLSCMMLFLATLYDVQQLNLSRFFLTKDDSYVDPTFAGGAETFSITNQNYGVSSYTRHMDDDSPPVVPFETVGFYQTTASP